MEKNILGDTVDLVGFLLTPNFMNHWLNHPLMNVSHKSACRMMLLQHVFNECNQNNVNFIHNLDLHRNVTYRLGEKI